MDISLLRQRMHDFIDKGSYSTALFWANKCLCLSKGQIRDYYWLLHIHAMNGHHRRAIQIIQNKNLTEAHLIFVYFMAKCYAERKEWLEALRIIEKMNEGGNCEPSDEDITGVPTTKVRSCLYLLCGKIYEAVNNISMAKACYKQALEFDLYCSEAMDLLINQHMLSVDEEVQLLDSLSNCQQYSDAERQFILQMYRRKTAKQESVESKLSNGAEIFSHDTDSLLDLAKRHCLRTDYDASYKITSTILEEDPYHEECIPFHVI
ncbi:Cell division cycle protein 16-like protein [Trichoplax sp. H2]|nr:Cell division cycle protein 16-like protein [Trichoplax sp. H2]|eukprot:RDD37002.1 Cell division cycle protein 16-like protein [Trichoplax sp. H2]